jgi:hypothetical protein
MQFRWHNYIFVFQGCSHTAKLNWSEDNNMVKKIFFSATSVFFAFFLFVFLGMVVYADGASEDSEELVIEDGKYYQDYTSSIYHDEGKTIDQYLRTGYA